MGVKTSSLITWKRCKCSRQP